MIVARGKLVRVVLVLSLVLLGLFVAKADAAPPSASIQNTWLATASSSRDVAVKGGFVYWSNTWTGTIGRANINGTGVNQNFITGLTFPSGIDIEGPYIYWGSYNGLTVGASSVGRANLDGTNVIPSFVAGGTGVTGVDATATNLYWTNSEGDTIGRSDIGGTNVNQSFIVTLDRPWSIAVNGSSIYWSNFYGESIGTSTLTGTNVNQNLVKLPTGVFPTGVAVDGSFVYWATYGTTNTIGRSTLAGANVNTTYVSGTGITDSVGVDVDGTYVYWSRVTQTVADRALPYSLGRALLDSTNPVLSGPASLTVAATSASGASVTYSPPVTAADPDDAGLIPTCVGGPNTTTGGTFPVGTTTVNCSATDPTGNVGTLTFTVTVTPFVPGPPIPPQLAGVDILSSSSVRVRWTDNATNETGFLVFRIGPAGRVEVNCPQFTPNLTQCVDTGLTAGVYYQYFVYAWNATASLSSGSYMMAIIPPERPTAPSVGYAFPTGPNSVKVGWQDNSTNETGFRIHRYTANASTDLITGPNVTSAVYSDPTMSTASSHVFIISAIGATAETYADTYIFSRDLGPAETTLNPPDFVSATNVTGTSATITWKNNATNNNGFLVYRLDGPNTVLVPTCSVSNPALTSCVDSGLTPGVFYQYFIYAWNNSGSARAGTSMMVHTPKPLAAPEIIDAEGSSLPGAPTGSISLHWVDKSSDETGYEIYEYANGGLTLLTTVAANSTGYTVSGLPLNSLRVYTVAAVRSGDRAYSPFGIWSSTPV